MASTTARLSGYSDAPCALDATLWRDCLKSFDYSPERPQNACETQRTQYYTCIKKWRRDVVGEAAPDASAFYLTPKCASQADQLHQCMMINMFEVSRCKLAMLRLKGCAFENDPAVRKSLEDDEEVRQFLAEKSQNEGAALWFKKALGKA